jgi:hypothetical protein
MCFDRIPGSLSTNAAIFASVLLASRLDTNLDVFGLLSFAVEWFALFPIFRRHLQVRGSSEWVRRSLADTHTHSLSLSLILEPEFKAISLTNHFDALPLRGPLHSGFESGGHTVPFWILLLDVRMPLLAHLYSKVQKVSDMPLEKVQVPK